MSQVLVNTCICNATRRNIHHSGVWIEHITWESSDETFTCSGRNTVYAIQCAQKRPTEAGFNANKVLLIICLLLVLQMIMMFYKIRKYENIQHYKVQKSDEINEESLKMTTLDDNENGNVFGSK